MKILVTGAGGLIGRYLATFLANRGEEVIAGYRNTTPNLLNGPSKYIRTLKLDISETLENLEAVDIVIHAAAHTHLIPDSTTDQYVRSNVIGTINLAEYAQRTKPSLFIYLSTISMFGQVNVDVLREDTVPVGPGIYGMTKLLAEKALEEKASDFPSVSIRLPGVVGEGYFTPWLGTVLKNAYQSNPITIYNPQSMFNNVIDLEELSKFVCHLIERPNIGFETVNLAASEPILIRKLVNLILELTESRSELVEKDTQRQSFTINTDKLVNELGYYPTTTTLLLKRYLEVNKHLLNPIRVD